MAEVMESDPRDLCLLEKDRERSIHKVRRVDGATPLVGEDEIMLFPVAAGPPLSQLSLPVSGESRCANLAEENVPSGSRGLRGGDLEAASWDVLQRSRDSQRAASNVD